MKKNILAEFKLNREYFLYSLLISICTMLPQLFFSPNLIHSFILSAILLLLIAIAKFSKLLFAIFIVFINFTNIFIGHIALHWGYNIPDVKPRIEAAFFSPAYETHEYLSKYIDYRDLILVVNTLFVFFLLYKFLRQFNHSYKLLRVIGLGVFTAILIALSLYKNPFKEIEPISLAHKCYVTYKNKQDYQTLLDQRKKLLAGISIKKVNPNNLIYDKVIIVMGESVNKNHMSIYGYNVPTTPFLTSLSRSKNFFVFNAIAPTNQTRYSVPIDLTDARVGNYEKSFSHSCAIVSNFKVNGYDTYWISNQGQVGKNDSTISSMALEANHVHFANIRYDAAETDDVLLKDLDNTDINSSKKMYVLHIMGSHFDYKKRYKSKSALYKNSNNIVEEYDNSIHFTDSVLQAIYEKFKKEKLLIVYVSDHGEVVNLKKNGHGFLPPYKDEFNVPFLIYSNVKNVKLDEIYKDNQKGTFNLESLNSILGYIVGINNEKNVSYSQDVIALEPSNIFKYEQLKFYK